MNLLVDSDEWHFGHFGHFGIIVGITPSTRDSGTIPQLKARLVCSVAMTRDLAIMTAAPQSKALPQINTKLWRLDHRASLQRDPLSVFGK